MDKNFEYKFDSRNSIGGGGEGGSWIKISSTNFLFSEGRRGCIFIFIAKRISFINMIRR